MGWKALEAGWKGGRKVGWKPRPSSIEAAMATLR